MKTLYVWISAVLVLSIGCGVKRKKEDSSQVKSDGDGLVGTSCNIQPIVRDSQSLNVCIWPQTNWPGLERGVLYYAFPNSLTAVDQAVRACHDANALDYGTALGTSCFHLCEKVVHCLPFTPSP